MQDLTLWSKLSAGRNLWTSLRVLEALLAFGSWMACLVLSLASKRDSLCLVSPVIHFHVCLGGLIAVHKQNLILIFLYRTVVEFEIFHLAKFYYQKTNTRWFLSTDVDIILDVRCFTMRKCAVSSPFCNRAHCQRRMHWPSGVLLWHLPLHVQNEWLSGSWVKMALKETHPSFKRRCQRNPSIHPIVSGSWVNCQDGSILHPSSLIHWHLAERNFDQSFAKMLWNPSPGGFPASDVVAAESDVTAANLISFAYGNHFKVGLGLIVWWKTWTWKVWSFWSFCPFQIGVLWNSEYLVHQSLYKFVVGKGAEIAKFSGTQIL